MKAFVLSQKAMADLRAKAVFTEQGWGRQQRNLYIMQFDDTFHLLAKTPMAGKTCDYIKQGYRKFPQGSHLIFYKDGSNGQIEIVRILHKNMDTEVKFLQPGRP